MLALQGELKAVQAREAAKCEARVRKLEIELGFQQQEVCVCISV